MRDTRTNFLTQDDLVAELHSRDYSDITVRRVAAWRAHDLLPPFDRAGAGRGQRLGRERSSWADGDSIINQAMWICELSQSYESLDDLALPIWMLGYYVPLRRVRQALSEPLEQLTQAIEGEVNSSGELEDMIGDAAYEYAKKVAREGVKLLEMPQDSIEAFLNVFFNPAYNLSDAPFEDAVEALREHEREVLEEHVAALCTKGLEIDPTRQNDRDPGGIFKHAPLVKEYFSLYQLKCAVDECTDEDLRAVERDVDIMREAVLLLRKLFSILARDLGADFDMMLTRTLPLLFTIGKLIIWADLSLRRRGYSQIIDTSLPEALRLLREKCDENFEREIAEASQSVAFAVNTTIEVMAESFGQSEGASESA